MKLKNFSWFFVLLFILIGCSSGEKNEKDLIYKKEINKWRNRRITNLKRDNGWLNLVGLYWLKQGTNTFGSDQTNNIVFPSGAPKFIGKFILNGNSVTAKINNGVDVYHKGSKVTAITLKDDMSPEAMVLAVGPFRFFVIKRGDRYGIRLRNLDAPLVKNFKGIKYYPIDKKWRVKAKFEKYNTPKILSIPTVIGTIEEDTSFGRLKFNINGKEYGLDPINADKKFFIILADETSGNETYGGGRFLYAPKPDSTGTTIIDFNKAYNPPCAFTKYATCPLPPKDNYLKLKITAGEKVYGHGH